MIVVCMTSMRSSTAKPFLVLCGLSDLERNLKRLVEVSRVQQTKEAKEEFYRKRNKS